MIKAIVGSNNPVKIFAASRAFDKILPNNQVHIKNKQTNSGVSSQPVGLAETKTGALNRMQQCIPEDLINDTLFAIGMENGLIPGSELNHLFGSETYSLLHWYDIGVCAVTMMVDGCSFKYVAYAEPLEIPNNEATGFLPPSSPEKNNVNIEKYRQIIMPLISKGIDLYQWYSKDELSRESTLSQACADAICRLRNISVYNSCIPKTDVVILFGTFDIFHDLHKRLIDCAYSIADKLVIYVYHKEYKTKNNTKINLSDNIQQRITNVSTYAARKGKYIIVKRMKYNHPVQLQKAIDFYSKNHTITIMGGEDQFDYDKIVNICFQNKIPIVAIDRGETKIKLCSSDLRRRMSFQRISHIYDLDLDKISPFFWKQNIESKSDAVQYLKQLNNLGLESTEIWHYQPKKLLDRKIIKPINLNVGGKLILCLPGRKPCNIDRMRKIAATIDEDYVEYNSLINISIYVCSYEQNKFDTGYHIRNFMNNNYFGDDAMFLTKNIIVPGICTGIFVDKLGFHWKVTKTNNTIIYPHDIIKENFSKIIISCRSLGSVVAVEMESAVKFVMVKLDFDEKDIIDLLKYIKVVSISNLVAIDRPRLFTTVSVTGLNDKIAHKYIKNLATANLSKLSKFVSDNHYAVLATIPNKIINIKTKMEIEDDNCHYTPLFITINEGDNTIPFFVRHAHKLMLENIVSNLQQL